MRRHYPAVLVLLTVMGGGIAHGDDPPKPEATKPRVTLSRETTYFVKPLTDDGFVDYAASINEKLSDGVTPENNAAVALMKVLGPAPEGIAIPDACFERLGMTPPPKEGPYLLSMDAFLKDREIAAGDPRSDAIHEVYGKTAPWRKEQCPEVADWLAANEKHLDAVAEATKRPRYFFPLIIEKNEAGASQGLIDALLHGVQMHRELARALAARAMLRLGERDADGAWGDIMAGRRLGRLVGQGPMMIQTLVGYAIDAIMTQASVAFIEHAGLDARRVRDCLREIDTLLPVAAMADKVDIGERCLYLDAVQNMARDIDGMKPPIGGDEIVRLLEGLRKARIFGVDWDETLKVGNIWYDRIVTAMRIENREQRNQALAIMEDDLKKTRGSVSNPLKMFASIATSGDPRGECGRTLGRVLITLILPAAKQAREAEDRTVQRDAMLRIAFALQAYRSDRGRYPATLGELSPQHLKEVPQDLFGEKPLVYKPDASGYLLYSVGPDGVDDGGASHEDGPKRGDDLRIRMPAKR